MRSRKSAGSPKPRLQKHGNFEQLPRSEEKQEAKHKYSGDRLRRCHLCSHTTASEGEVRHCGNCGKLFNPFYFFSETMVFVDADGTRPEIAKGEFKALIGFTVLWSDSDVIE